MMKMRNLFSLMLTAAFVTFIGVSCTNEASNLERADSSLLILKEKLPEVHGLVDLNSFQSYEFETEAGDYLLLEGYSVVKDGNTLGYYLNHQGEMIYTAIAEERIIHTNLTNDVEVVVLTKLDREQDRMVPDFDRSSAVIIESYEDSANRGLCEIACNVAMGVCMGACGVGTGVVALADSPVPGPADAAAVALFAACIEACQRARNECYNLC